MVQVLQLLLEIVQAFPLRPVIRIIVQVPQVTAIPLFPKRELRFHHFQFTKLGTVRRETSFGERCAPATARCPV